jgi:hypothetical protein
MLTAGDGGPHLPHMSGIAPVPLRRDECGIARPGGDRAQLDGGFRARGSASADVEAQYAAESGSTQARAYTVGLKGADVSRPMP